MALTLRPYQARGASDIRASYMQGHRAPLFVLPTGGGKTVLFTYISQVTASRAKRVLILVHRVELLRQTSKTLLKFGVRHGLISPKYTPDYTAPVQVAGVQTLINRTARAGAFDLIVIDEAHHATAGTWRKVLGAYPRARVLGVTATPIRTDGAGLGVNAGGIFDDLIQGPTARELIGMGYLVRPKVYAPANRIDLAGVRMQMGDYNKKQLQKAVDKPRITGDAVAHYRKLCDGVPAVAFCISVKHAEHVADAFRAGGYRAACVEGRMDGAERKRRIEGLANGEVQILTNCDLIGEGVDVPAIGAVISLRPTASTGLYLQQCGRALRPYEGKEHAVILDHAGNAITHGMPDADREWSLDGAPKRGRGKKKEKEIKVDHCPQCYTCHEPAPICPECGHAYKANTRNIREEAGELVEFTAEQKRAKARERKREEAEAQTLEDLRTLAAQRGYSPGWAYHRFKARLNKNG